MPSTNLAGKSEADPSAKFISVSLFFKEKVYSKLSCLNGADDYFFFPFMFFPATHIDTFEIVAVKIVSLILIRCFSIFRVDYDLIIVLNFWSSCNCNFYLIS